MKDYQQEMRAGATESSKANNDKNMVTIFGKKMDRDALDMLERVIGNSLNVVAEHGAKDGWSEEQIKAATRSVAVGITYGFRSLVEGSKGYPKD